MTETRDESVNWLTQEAYDRLKTEFDYLSGERTWKIVACFAESFLAIWLF